MNIQELKPMTLDIFLRLIELNEKIIKQNELIVQALTLPSLIIKGKQNDQI